MLRRNRDRLLTALLADRPLCRTLGTRTARWLSAAGMTILYLAWPIAQSHVFGVTGIALCAAVLLIGAYTADTRTGTPTSALLLAPLRWSGTLSYELYLFHLVVLGGLRTLYPPSDTPGNEKLLLLGVYLVLSAAVSTLIAWGYATPLNRFVKRQWLRAAARIPHAALRYQFLCIGCIGFQRSGAPRREALNSRSLSHAVRITRALEDGCVKCEPHPNRHAPWCSQAILETRGRYNGCETHWR